MHPEDIKATLAKKGITLAMIARELGVSRPMVSFIVHSHARNQRVEQRIAELADQPLAVLWPTWYGNGGAAA